MVKLSNFSNLVISQLGFIVGFATSDRFRLISTCLFSRGAHFCAMRMPALRYHISSVVLDCAKKQMSGVHTGRVVTPMTNTHIVGKFAIRNQVCSTVREQVVSVFVTAVAHAKIAIAFLSAKGSPVPAFVGVVCAVNFRPETRKVRRGKLRGSHKELTFLIG